MQILSQTQLNNDIANIQVLHGRLGNDFAKCLAYHTGGLSNLKALNQTNVLIGHYKDILYRYEVVGDSTLNNLKNTLTTTDIEAIVDDCYRRLEKYNY